MGEISYPLYLLHKPLGEFLPGFARRLGVERSWVASAVTLLTVIGLASLVHYLVEIPCVRFGRRLLIKS